MGGEGEGESQFFKKEQGGGLKLEKQTKITQFQSF